MSSRAIVSLSNSVKSNRIVRSFSTTLNRTKRIGTQRQHASKILSEPLMQQNGTLFSSTIKLAPTFSRSYATLPKGVRELKMPSLSPTMEAGKLAKWRVKEGEKVVAGDVICEVMTDKAKLEFESQEEFIVAKFVRPEDTETDLPLGTVIALVAENADAAKAAKALDYSASSAPAASAAAPAAPQPSSPSTSAPSTAPSATPVTSASSTESGRVFASPLAKKTADEKGVNLSSIQGTGPNNRIIKADVEEFSAKAPATAAPAAAVSAPAVSTADYKDIPITQVRKVIADRLLQSKRNIPHFYLTVECQMDQLLALRTRLNKLGDKKGFKLSVNDFIVKACALSMKKHPEVNSSWQDTFIRQYNNVDINVAVQTDNGLITPIVFDAEKKGLAEISNNVKALAQKARDGKLQPQEFQGGSFTISNLGMFGIQEFAAIINPPQVCILAVGTTEKKVIPNEDAKAESPFKVATTMKVTLSCDHRVVDGAVGAQWLQVFKEYIENPEMLML